MTITLHYKPYQILQDQRKETSLQQLECLRMVHWVPSLLMVIGGTTMAMLMVIVMFVRDVDGTGLSESASAKWHSQPLIVWFYIGTGVAVGGLVLMLTKLAKSQARVSSRLHKHLESLALKYCKQPSAQFSIFDSDAFYAADRRRQTQRRKSETRNLGQEAQQPKALDT